MKTLCFTLFLLAALSQSSSAQTTTPAMTFLCPPCGLDCDTVHFDKPGICPVCGMKLFASYVGYENRQGKHRDFIDKKVAVLFFPGVEIIDFSGPWEVFGAAGMEVYAVAASDSIVQTNMGLKLKPDYSFSNAPVPDVILVPGGRVDISDTASINWIVKMSKTAEHTMSVCTGAFYLAAGGLLDSLQATTNFPAIGMLRQLAPTATVVDSMRYVDNGQVITAAGLSSGIDAALHLVSLHIGKAQTQKLANELEYHWDEEDQFVRGKLADKFVQDFLNVFTPFDYQMAQYAGDETRWVVSLNVQTNLTEADLRKLLRVQIEDVSGWLPTNSENAWSFEEEGEKWLSKLALERTGATGYSVLLQVKRMLK